MEISSLFVCYKLLIWCWCGKFAKGGQRTCETAPYRVCMTCQTTKIGQTTKIWHDDIRSFRTRPNFTVLCKFPLHPHKIWTQFSGCFDFDQVVIIVSLLFNAKAEWIFGTQWFSYEIQKFSKADHLFLFTLSLKLLYTTLLWTMIKFCCE